jgi:hypothetical protein
MIPDGTSPEAIVLAVAASLLVSSTLVVTLFWYRSPEKFQWIVKLLRPKTVNQLGSGAPEIMSRKPISAAPSMPSSLQTDSRPIPDRRMMPVPMQPEMLDIFKVLRARGVTRTEIVGLWRAAGLPFDNNLWTAAAPDEDDTHITPIAGRPTRAQFDVDPELQYETPPR